jgi:membrane protease subunit HflK
VVQAAESAVREIVGKHTMDSVLYEQRDADRADLAKSIQASWTAEGRHPGQERQPAERAAARAGAGGVRRRLQGRCQPRALKNEAQAYANDVIPRAGQSPLREEAEGYKARVVAQAEGDAQRFRACRVPEGAAGHARPALHRHDAAGLQQRHQGDGGQPSGSNLLYLPLDKLMQQGSRAAAGVAAAAQRAGRGAGAANVPSPADRAAVTAAQPRRPLIQRPE